MKAPSYRKGFVTKWRYSAQEQGNIIFLAQFFTLKEHNASLKMAFGLWPLGHLLFSQGIKYTDCCNGTHPNPSLMNSVGSQP